MKLRNRLQSDQQPAPPEVSMQGAAHANEAAVIKGRVLHDVATGLARLDTVVAVHAIEQLRIRGDALRVASVYPGISVQAAGQIVGTFNDGSPRAVVVVRHGWTVSEAVSGSRATIGAGAALVASVSADRRTKTGR